MANGIRADGPVPPRACSGPTTRSHSARERRGLPGVLRVRPVGLLVGEALRRLRQSPPEWVRLCRIARFFFARQPPLQTAAVNRDTELFLNGLDTGDSRQAWLGSSQGSHVFDDLGGQLVSFFWATVLGKQADQALLLECSLSLVNSGARNAKLGSHVDDR